jgi:UDP-2-acetamido-2,6-beta-L-arabino-hexul-4-ose reductase
VRIVVTGADGFVGRNLLWRLRERGEIDLACITRKTGATERAAALGAADFVFHLAGVNRPADPADFATQNAGLTQEICSELSSAGRRATLVFASSTQAALDNPYGRSKRQAEEFVKEYARSAGSRVHVCRLTNLFGKWARPHYNSVVATFCHNIARGLPIEIRDPNAPLRLLYVDDLVDAFYGLLQGAPGAGDSPDIGPVYDTTLGQLAETLTGFASSRQTLEVSGTGAGLTRALFATYLSYLPADSFDYRIPLHRDPRGEFVEMLKTPDSGQFSYFTSRPGVTRGEHYHHSKTEKFLVIRGRARFQFRHIDSGERAELDVAGGEGRVVETAPGWTHNVINIGDDELVVMLWANEVFDRSRPDTFALEVAE